MILLCGIPTESPLALVAAALDRLGAEYLVLNQRRFGSSHLSFTIRNGQVSGLLEYEGREISLTEIDGVYVRLMDHRALPELAREEPNSALHRHCEAWHDVLLRWLEVTPARVLNRTAPMCSNSSKPYQGQLIQRYGLHTPETLITSNPDAVKRFLEQHGRIIYKSISGVRSIVQTLDESALERIERVRWCPTQFQRYLPGRDVRVHVVGEETFATAITSTATDYRYAQTQVGEAAELTPVQLPDAVEQACVKLAAGLGLGFAGIDLKFTPEGEVYCFEVNPCPGYSYYEANTGQLISEAVARYLVGQPVPAPKTVAVPDNAAVPVGAGVV